MITDLFTVKLYHGEYESISETAPDVDFDESEGYSVGYRLLVKDGTSWECRDASIGAAIWANIVKDDFMIVERTRDLSDLICKFCDNTFTDINQNLRIPGGSYYGTFPYSDVDYYSSNTLTFAGPIVSDVNAGWENIFHPGDTIRIDLSKRNDSYYDVTEVTDSEITAERDFSLDVVDDTGQITVVRWPEGLSSIAARMVGYDVYGRPKTGGFTGESIGSYSYQKGTVDFLGIGYPEEIVAGLMTYKRPRFR